MSKVMIELDLDQPVQRQLFDTWHLLMTSSTPHLLIEHLKETQTYRDFLRPLAAAINADQDYTAEGLGQLFTPTLTARQVAAAIAKIGKPEKRYGGRVIQRRNPTGSLSGRLRYSITEEVRDALLSEND